MKNKLAFLMFLLCMWASTSACSATFSGKVVDADTKEPVTGAVVVAVWREETATVAGPSTRFKDVKETLTDKNGAWTIEGPRGQEGGTITALFNYLTGTYYTRTPEFIIFKPGYCSWPEGLAISVCREKLRPYSVGNGEVTQLPKLINREDRRRVLPDYISGESKDRAEIKKQKEFIRLINEERRNLGMSEFKLEELMK